MAEGQQTRSLAPIAGPEPVDSLAPGAIAVRERISLVGNPGGRPRGLARLIRERTKDGEEIVELFLGVMRDDKETRKLRMEAAAWLGEHGFGKPPQAVELTGSEGGPIITAALDLPTEDLAALLDFVRAFEVGGPNDGGPSA